MRRLLTLEKTTAGFFQEYSERVKQTASPPREGSFVPPHRTAVSTAGPFFTRLVLHNYRQDTITGSDVAEYLNVRLKHLP